MLCAQKHDSAFKITSLREYLQFLKSGEYITFDQPEMTYIHENIKHIPSNKKKKTINRFTCGISFMFLERCDYLLDSVDNDIIKQRTTKDFRNSCFSYASWIICGNN